MRHVSIPNKPSPTVVPVDARDTHRRNGSSPAPPLLGTAGKLPLTHLFVAAHHRVQEENRQLFARQLQIG
eukprot:1184059-Prorocentrum_minimum.AAC.4